MKLLVLVLLVFMGCTAHESVQTAALKEGEEVRIDFESDGPDWKDVYLDMFETSEAKDAGLVQPDDGDPAWSIIASCGSSDIGSSCCVGWNSVFCCAYRHIGSESFSGFCAGKASKP